MRQETEKAGPQKQRIKQPHSQESDRKDNHLDPKGSPREVQLHLGFGKSPFLYRLGFMSFWHLSSGEVWLRQESGETLPGEVSLTDQ